MSYVQNPMKEYKDFATIANDVNNNFEHFVEQYGIWKKIGEGKISGTSGGTISADIYKCDRIICILNGTLGTNTQVNFAKEHYNGSERFVLSNDNETETVALINKTIEYLCGIDGHLIALHNTATSSYSNDSGRSISVSLYRYSSKQAIGESDFTVTIYGLKKSDAMLNILGVE